jgi:hypothetical protein
MTASVFINTLKYERAKREIESAITWAWAQEEELGIICGENADLTVDQMEIFFRYLPIQIETILFMRKLAQASDHKKSSLPTSDDTSD